ncbi:MAG: hypothetical protein ACC726_04965 [Chloroflexota bacterium]
MKFGDDQDPRDEAAPAATLAIWEDLAVQARRVHCPEHVVTPWRVAVRGDTRATMSLQVSGCCAKLGVAVTAMIRNDPRISGPS